MAIVTFKPVCECGYIFRHFEYDFNPKPPIKVYAADNETNDTHKLCCLLQHNIDPEICPNCGKVIRGFKIPVIRGDELVYNEEEKK